MNEVHTPASPEDATTEEHALSQEAKARFRKEQNLFKGIALSVATVIASILLWVMIIEITGYRFSFMVVIAGFFIGHAMRYGGQGVDLKFGIAGAVIAFVGVYLGNCTSILAIIAKDSGSDIFHTFSVLGMERVAQLGIKHWESDDLVFYSIATYEGYRFAFRKAN